MFNKIKKIAPTKQRIILLVVVFLAFILRFYKLTDVPPGLGRDEASVAYNAYSIIETARDEHGRFMPLYFEAIGDQKLPVIVYLSTLSIKVFGLTELGARFPFALLGSLTVFFLYLLIKQMATIEKSVNFKWILLLAPFLLAVNPWHLAHSRAVYEITLGTFFFTAGTYCFLKGLVSKKWFILSLTVFIVAFYTYSMTRLLSPLIFLSYLLIFHQEVKSFPRAFWLLIILWSSLLLSPFIMNFFDPGGIYGPKGAVILTSSKVASSIIEFRSYIVNSQAGFLGPIFFNKVVMIFYEYARNILTALSLDFYFAHGSDMAGIGTNGQFYLIEVLPFIIGLIFAVRKAINGQRIFRLILVWIVITFLSASLTIGPPYATRTLFIVVPVVTLTAFGWSIILNWLKKQKLYYRSFLAFIVLIYFWHFTFYLFSYYIRFPVVYAQNWEAKNKELFEYLEKEEDDVDYIVITKPEYSMYAFLLFYHKVPPKEVWSKLERHLPDPDGWKHGKKFGKYEFRDIDWQNDIGPKRNVILVAHGGEYPDRTVVTHEILYPTKYTVYPYGQNVIALPERKVAFRIWRITPERE